MLKEKQNEATKDHHTLQSKSV